MVVKPAYQLEPDDGSVRQPGPAGIAIPAAVEQDASHFRIRLRIEVRKELGSHFQNIRDNVRLLVRDRPYLLMTAFFDIPPRTWANVLKSEPPVLLGHQVASHL